MVPSNGLTLNKVRSLGLPPEYVRAFAELQQRVEELEEFNGLLKKQLEEINSSTAQDFQNLTEEIHRAKLPPQEQVILRLMAR